MRAGQRQPLAVLRFRDLENVAGGRDQLHPDDERRELRPPRDGRVVRVRAADGTDLEVPELQDDRGWRRARFLSASQSWRSVTPAWTVTRSLATLISST